MSKSILYAANTNPQTFIANGSIVNFGSIIRRYGCNVVLSGGNAVVDGQGYYDVDVNLTFTAAAGTVVVQIFKDGVAVQGAEATITTVADTSYAVTIPTIVRQSCCCESTITVVISGVAGTISNASIKVEKE